MDDNGEASQPALSPDGGEDHAPDAGGAPGAGDAPGREADDALRRDAGDALRRDADDGITVEEADGTTVVALYGEIDAGQREAASRAMVAVLAGASPLVLDTSRVRFIDSSGLAFLLQLHAVAADSGRPVALRDPSGAVVDLLALVGLDTLFSTTQTQAV